MSFSDSRDPSRLEVLNLRRQVVHTADEGLVLFAYSMLTRIIIAIPTSDTA